MKSNFVLHPWRKQVSETVFEPYNWGQHGCNIATPPPTEYPDRESTLWLQQTRSPVLS
jgi:hypothetical protein